MLDDSRLGPIISKKSNYAVHMNLLELFTSSNTKKGMEEINRKKAVSGQHLNLKISNQNVAVTKFSQLFLSTTIVPSANISQIIFSKLLFSILKI